MSGTLLRDDRLAPASEERFYFSHGTLGTRVVDVRKLRAPLAPATLARARARALAGFAPGELDRLRRTLEWF